MRLGDHFERVRHRPRSEKGRVSGDRRSHAVPCVRHLSSRAALFRALRAGRAAERVVLVAWHRKPAATKPGGQPRPLATRPRQVAFGRCPTRRRCPGSPIRTVGQGPARHVPRSQSALKPRSPGRHSIVGDGARACACPPQRLRAAAACRRSSPARAAAARLGEGRREHLASSRSTVTACRHRQDLAELVSDITRCNPARAPRRT